MSKYCNCSKELFRFKEDIHQHLETKVILTDLVLIEGTLKNEYHCNVCDKPLIDMGTYIKRDN